MPIYYKSKSNIFLNNNLKIYLGSLHIKPIYIKISIKSRRFKIQISLNYILISHWFLKQKTKKELVKVL